MEVSENLDSSRLTMGIKVFFGEIPTILPVVHVVKLGHITGMNLDLLVAFLLAKILWPWNVPKIVLKLHSSTQ